ncbi:hypothetical protein HPB51_015308 [Rhipicephalus microplus]|uniref:Uncharacterized protein n=1 Tax=Rhipicephalus microplus TaxID=6941 RepID=A0A9J6EH23_RHIMP|nr:hypothetical protein HPB51_015308 [Rhipicephalus microplus]
MDKPMVPFLSAALESILHSLLSRIVKREVLDAADTIAKLMKIDLSLPENAVNVAAFDVGFLAKNELRKNKKLSQLAIMNFKKGCIWFVKACAQKGVERSPLKYKLAMGAGCLDPVCALSLEAGPRRLTLALEVLSEHHWMTGLQAERAHRSYVKVCSESSTRLANFDRKKQRLDTLWTNVCSQDHKELQFFVKLLSCLSHGNAVVERGFSVNKECLVENLKEDFLVAQRVVHDVVLAAGGIAQVDITDKMVKTIRSAYSIYREQLQTKKRERE